MIFKNTSIARLFVEYFIYIIICLFVASVLIRSDYRFLQQIAYLFAFLPIPVFSIIYTVRITKKINTHHRILMGIPLFFLLFSLPSFLLLIVVNLWHGFS